VILTTLTTGAPNVTILQKRNIQTGIFEDVPLGKYSVLNNIVTVYSVLMIDSGEYRACVYNLPRNRACGSSFSLTVTGILYVCVVYVCVCVCVCVFAGQVYIPWDTVVMTSTQVFFLACLTSYV